MAMSDAPAAPACKMCLRVMVIGLTPPAIGSSFPRLVASGAANGLPHPTIACAGYGGRRRRGRSDRMSAMATWIVAVSQAAGAAASPPATPAPEVVAPGVELLRGAILP